MSNRDIPATLAERHAMLEDIARMAIEAAHRQLVNMRKVSAMARALSRGDVPEGDRAALAATLRQPGEHCECETQGHLDMLLAATMQQPADDGDADHEALLRAMSLFSMTRH